ncbi:MAG: formylglycine-generating enzyme family protein [Spirochaetaceae bacterium]|nr:formylglycine-generating enzyme family protein [Spirochaetaceae bacterium]
MINKINFVSFCITLLAFHILISCENHWMIDILGKYDKDRGKYSPQIQDFEWIQPGIFTMGSPTDEDGRLNHEIQHRVTLTKGFYMSKYLVTQEQYQSVIGSNPSYFQNDPAIGEEQGKRPVERVSWYEAIVFCNKLSIEKGLTPVYIKDGKTNPDEWGTAPISDYDPIWDTIIMSSTAKGYRLPTEAEWEYACRAGKQTAFNNGNNDYTNNASVGAVAWYSNNSDAKTHEVGKKIPNTWGLYDMHGNVYEWCWDWYAAYTGTATDPEGPASGTARVIRGGYWDSDAAGIRSAYRIDDKPWDWNGGVGFRLVRQ